MRISPGRMTSWVVALSLSLGAVAWAQEAKVEVRADVILASSEGSVIEPPGLAWVKEEFAKAGFGFTSYRRLSSNPLQLTKAAPAELKLPNQKTVNLKLEGIKDGTASVSVKAEGTEVTIQLGREGSVFQRVGSHQNGQLILMLSAGSSKRPRRGQALSHPVGPLPTSGRQTR